MFIRTGSKRLMSVSYTLLSVYSIDIKRRDVIGFTYIITPFIQYVSVQ